MPESKENYNFDSFELFDIPDSWHWAPISELISKEKHSLKAGPFGSSLKKEFYVKNGYKIYGQEQVINNDAFYGDYFIEDKKYKELESCKVKPFDVLISLVGTVGKVLILPENCQKGIINPRLVKVSLNLDVYNPHFFKLYFTSSILKSYYAEVIHGSTMDVLNLGIIKSLPYPIPLLKEQQEIVRRVEALFALADQLEARYKKAQSYVEKLTQSILAKAFRGELVPQDPNDEPASVLLERIKAEREKVQPLTVTKPKSSKKSAKLSVKSHKKRR